MQNAYGAFLFLIEELFFVPSVTAMSDKDIVPLWLAWRQ